VSSGSRTAKCHKNSFGHDDPHYQHRRSHVPITQRLCGAIATCLGRLSEAALVRGSRSGPGQPALDEIQPVLAPEDFITDDVARRAEQAAREGGFSVAPALLGPSLLG